MALSASVKQEIFTKYQRDPKDTGSSEVQIAMLTQRIRDLTEHMKEHKHDFHTNHGLLKLVGQRRRLMRYLERENVTKYRELIEDLGIRG